VRFLACFGYCISISELTENQRKILGEGERERQREPHRTKHTNTLNAIQLRSVYLSTCSLRESNSRSTALPQYAPLSLSLTELGYLSPTPLAQAVAIHSKNRRGICTAAVDGGSAERRQQQHPTERALDFLNIILR